jgi:osmotically-inducible protein OsmY
VATLGAVQGCIPVIVGGTGMAVAMVSDRRSSGTYLEDEGIEWKAGKWISDRLGDKVHANATAFNRKLLLTGEAFNEEPAAKKPAALPPAVENVREVDQRAARRPDQQPSATAANDSYISSKVKARFVDQKDFHVQQVKVTTEAGTTYLMGLVSRARRRAPPPRSPAPPRVSRRSCGCSNTSAKKKPAASTAPSSPPSANPVNQRSQHHEPS